MLIQSRQNITPQRQAFGAKLLFKEPVKQQLSQDIMDFYRTSTPEERRRHFGRKIPQPGKILDKLSEAFEARTKGSIGRDGIPGTVEFVIPTDKKYTAALQYKTARGVFLGDNAILDAREILPDKDQDRGLPYFSAITHLAACLSDAMAPTKGYTHKTNPFSKFFDFMIQF